MPQALETFLTTLFVSVLYREPKLLKLVEVGWRAQGAAVSVLYREPKLLKYDKDGQRKQEKRNVSVLYREPKLLKSVKALLPRQSEEGFSALP